MTEVSLVDKLSTDLVHDKSQSSKMLIREQEHLVSENLLFSAALVILVKPMKTLFVLRHAKSSWDDPDLADFDRPLNDRGRSAAPFMGEVMNRNGFSPDVILSSPAVRARDTALLVKDGGELSAEVLYEEGIYEASPQALKQIVATIDDENRSAMVVGHNPGMEGFIRFLTGRLESMPTAALAVIDLDIATWSEIDSASGVLREVIRPKDEMKTLGKGN